MPGDRLVVEADDEDLGLDLGGAFEDSAAP